MAGSGVLLLAAVAGYWVLERAERHKGNLKRVGQLLGWVIIVASLVGVACRVYAVASGKAFCPMSYSPDKGWWCPYSPKSALPPSQSR